MQYSHVHCLKGGDEASCSREQKHHMAYFLSVYTFNVRLWIARVLCFYLSHLWGSQYHYNHFLISFKTHDAQMKLYFITEHSILRLHSAASSWASFQFTCFPDKQFCTNRKIIFDVLGQPYPCPSPLNANLTLLPDALHSFPTVGMISPSWDPSSLW